MRALGRRAGRHPVHRDIPPGRLRRRGAVPQTRGGLRRQRAVPARGAGESQQGQHRLLPPLVEIHAAGHAPRGRRHVPRRVPRGASGGQAVQGQRPGASQHDKCGLRRPLARRRRRGARGGGSRAALRRGGPGEPGRTSPRPQRLPGQRGLRRRRLHPEQRHGPGGRGDDVRPDQHARHDDLRRVRQGYQSAHDGEPLPDLPFGPQEICGAAQRHPRPLRVQGRACCQSVGLHHRGRVRPKFGIARTSIGSPRIS
mmetsp:Transcript_6564/g.17612  ORF Transcript_6564/g.17612 Transcript_6564/m.17612 type:complete len:255 (-) Transcript_6564:257-1021(-)